MKTKKPKKRITRSKGGANLVKWFTGGGIHGMTVPKDEFPVRRKLPCCGNEAKKGESVLVFPYPKERAYGYLVVHVRCINEVIRNLPVDPQDIRSRYDKLRNSLASDPESFLYDAEH